VEVASAVLDAVELFSIGRVVVKLNVTAREVLILRVEVVPAFLVVFPTGFLHLVVVVEHARVTILILVVVYLFRYFVVCKKRVRISSHAVM
jgi:hypothetical protein